MVKTPSEWGVEKSGYGCPIYRLLTLIGECQSVKIYVRELNYWKYVPIDRITKNETVDSITADSDGICLFCKEAKRVEI